MRTRVRRHPCLRRVWRTRHTNDDIPNYRIWELIFLTNTKRKFGKANLPNDSNWHAKACCHAYPTLHSRRFGIPAEHYHKSFLTNSMIRLSISNLLCGRNAAPPTIANWHAIACCHADEGTQASLPATRLKDAPCKWFFPELSNLRIVLLYEHEYTEWNELAC